MNDGLEAKIIKVGLVGTGYAAQRRAEAFQDSSLSELMAVVGNSVENTQSFCDTYKVNFVGSWQELVNDSSLDLICICNVNRDHGSIVKAALLADKHVIVEYPLTVNPLEAGDLIDLAQQKQKLLHIEHIELLGGVHQALKKHLSDIGTPFLARYSTILSKTKVIPHWTYNYDYYGFPFIAAVSRINRFTDLFGEVDSVNCNARFWDASETGYFSSCWCQAQLSFKNEMMVNLTYGKGEKFKTSDRTLEIYGDEGTILFEGEKGKIIRGEEEITIEVGSRRGLFTLDTQIVLEHLTTGKPLYIKNTASAYSLKVAGATLQSYKNQQIIKL
ncbi:Gfo/Idh/MocA family oxidoreductase [Geminocystis sp. GBBB08]|uniref:Gfo/Idh/MocA family protein n=1 Tax=Geminocystis sp. GBBB08 TaxID=2604140 RepID=UPI0027E352F0|nr:Gfo/Idh/MocA family oxidoreductase [Geminocystis sp. GBBB08]MBL1209351.1 Gfo/Idh/MocA family oxidoreductase [Geminocystis sp. GBBB08]